MVFLGFLSKNMNDSVIGQTIYHMKADGDKLTKDGAHVEAGENDRKELHF